MEPEELPSPSFTTMFFSPVREDAVVGLVALFSNTTAVSSTPNPRATLADNTASCSASYKSPPSNIIVLYHAHHLYMFQRLCLSTPKLPVPIALLLRCLFLSLMSDMRQHECMCHPRPSLKVSPRPCVC